MKKVTIYCDGGCFPNPGKAAWAALLLYNGTQRIFVDSSEHGTNNTAELNAAILALKSLKETCSVEIISDSQYLVQGMTTWELGKRAMSGESMKNALLWRELYVLAQGHTVKWTWVKGHAGNRFNEEVHKHVEYTLFGG